MAVDEPSTKIGFLPGWRSMPLGSVLRRSGSPVAVDPYATYREIGIRSHGKGLFHKDAVTGTSLGDKRVFEVVPGALVLNIVFAWEGAVAVVSERERGMIASHRFPMFVPIEDSAVDVEFIRRFFQTSLGIRLLGEASPGGAGRNRTLNQRFAAAIQLPVPPIAEQRTIAAILSAVDDSIDAAQAIIEQLQVVKRATMAELLTRGMPGRHTRFKWTEIGEVPEAWAVRPLNEVARIFNGKASGTGGSWLRVFKTKHVYDGMVRLDKREFVRDDVAGKVRTDTYLHANDVLTPNMAHGTIGRVAFVPEVSPNWTVDGQVMVLRADGVAMMGRVLFEFLSLPQGRQRILDLEKGGAFDTLRGQTHIYPRDVSEILVAVPPTGEQQEIALAAAAFDEPFACNRENLASLRVVKHGLLEGLFTGGVRVTPNEVTT
jgi:type I restriction enzyme S subunit